MEANKTFGWNLQPHLLEVWVRGLEDSLEVWVRGQSGSGSARCSQVSQVSTSLKSSSLPVCQPSASPKLTTQSTVGTASTGRVLQQTCQHTCWWTVDHLSRDWGHSPSKLVEDVQEVSQCTVSWLVPVWPDQIYHPELNGCGTFLMTGECYHWFNGRVF